MSALISAVYQKQSVFREHVGKAIHQDIIPPSFKHTERGSENPLLDILYLQTLFLRYFHHFKWKNFTSYKASKSTWHQTSPHLLSVPLTFNLLSDALQTVIVPYKRTVLTPTQRTQHVYATNSEHNLKSRFWRLKFPNGHTMWTKTVKLEIIQTFNDVISYHHYAIFLMETMKGSCCYQ